jgi:predicted nucleic acid-binding protein
MEGDSRLSDLLPPLVLDTSVVINLIATRHALAIAQAIPNPIRVVETVLNELRAGRRPGRENFEHLNRLISASWVELVRLEDSALEYFSELVIGPAVDTLDDGEAATIAYALTNSGIPYIDERKANRLCLQRFPQLEVKCTVDLLFSDRVMNQLKDGPAAEAVFNALKDGRMRVLPRDFERVSCLIGLERAAQCPSLPRSMRASQ